MRGMRRTSLAAAAWVALLCVAGCQSLTEGAKETFSQENMCPLDRVEARERPELTSASVKPPGPPAVPPPEIAADPARLKMWRDQRAEAAARRDLGHHYAQARGCGKTVLYDCRGPTNEDRPQKPWFCSEVSNVPEAVAKW